MVGISIYVHKVYIIMVASVVHATKAMDETCVMEALEVADCCAQVFTEE